MDVRQIPKAPGELPSGAVNASLTKLMASANAGRPVDFAAYGGRDFLPATKFEGKKTGFVFTRGDRGVGYGSNRGSRIASNGKPPRRYYIDRQMSRENREALLQQRRALEEKERSAKPAATAPSSEALLRQAEEAAQAKTVSHDSEEGLPMLHLGPRCQVPQEVDGCL